MPDSRDAGSTLRSLHAKNGGVRAIFSSKVADYVASRPNYPAALLDALRALACTAPNGGCVADIGAGTGLLTRGLLERGLKVFAVEPNAAMRAAADENLRHFSDYQSLDGGAESMPLPDASIDLITAAQAFHWFDADAARAEFLRVLKPHGQVALIWNDRETDPLQTALDAIFEKYGGAKRGALVDHENRQAVPRFFGTGAMRKMTYSNEQQLDEAGLSCLVFSRSYIPDRDSALAPEVTAEVQRIFRDMAFGGTVTVRYQTIAIIGQPA